jgi:hypothetical protein
MTTAFPASAGPEPALLRVLEAARSFLSYRDRLNAITFSDAARPRDLAEAIDRDFLLFDMETAAQALRAAVVAAEAVAMPRAAQPGHAAGLA